MRVVYVSHNGVGTPLVRSQVLPYLRLLSGHGHTIDLVTFERGDPYPEGEFPRDRWHPVRPRPGRSLLVKVLDIARGAWVVGAVARRRRAGALHARSYVAAAICWAVGRVLGLPYIFDMRGFMGEEYVDAGLWVRGELRERALRAVERHLLRDAAEVIVLTNAGRRRLRTDPRYAPAASERRITVIPCAVDLDRFRPTGTKEPAPTLVYAGSLGTWYLLDEMIRVFTHAVRAEPRMRCLFLNRGEHSLIRAAWAAAGLPPDAMRIHAVDPRDMPAQLGRAHVGIALLRAAPSKIGSSPVKIAEYLACGLPVIVNVGLGDSDEQIRRARAGHVVEAYDDDTLVLAGRAAAALSADAEAGRRARALAEQVFDMRKGAALYAEVYARAGAP